MLTTPLHDHAGFGTPMYAYLTDSSRRRAWSVAPMGLAKHGLLSVPGSSRRRAWSDGPVGRPRQGVPPSDLHSLLRRARRSPSPMDPAGGFDSVHVWALLQDPLRSTDYRPLGENVSGVCCDTRGRPPKISW